MATRIITAYNSANSYQSIIILISQETLFFCLSNDVFFVEIEKVEEEEIEKKRLGKTHYFFNDQLRQKLTTVSSLFKGVKSFMKFI